MPLIRIRESLKTDLLILNYINVLVKMFISNTQTGVEALLAVFAGRVGMEGYDASKLIKIAECNRDFVWDESRQEKLIVSILEGYPIPSITICNNEVIDGGNRLTTLWLFRNGHFTIEFNGERMDYETMCGHRHLVRIWDSFQIPQTNVTNATPDEVSQIYQNLNQGVPLTFGQLLENRKRKPIVDFAMAMLGYSHTVIPFRDELSRVWYKPAARPKKTKSRGEIAFAYQILIASIEGPAWFNTNIMDHIDHIMSMHDSGPLPSTEKLQWILDMLDEVDPENAVPRPKKRDCFKRFIGAIIHDIHMKGMNGETRHKWQAFFRDAYHKLNKEHLKLLVDVREKRATNQLRVEELARKVGRYLECGELQQGIHIDLPSTDSEEESIESDDE